MIKKALFPMLILLMAATQTAWADGTFSGGSGSQAEPYLISSVEDWDALANSVNSGTTTYSGKYFKLTTDIDNPVTTMVGNSEQNTFQGFFIGNGKKLIVNYVTEEQYTAPFRYIDGATITGLTVDGIIQASAKFAGGLVGFAKGSNLISGCRSSVAIWSEVSGDGTHGGVVANINSGSTTIVNCLFDEWLLGDKTTDCGGFVGWCKTNGGAKVTLTNCLFNPSQVTMSASGSKTFVRYNESYPVTIDNCYFTDDTFGSDQGNSCKGISASSYVAALGDGWQQSGQNGAAVPIMDCNNIGSAIVTGLNKRYLYQNDNAIDIDYTVTATDGKVLTKGTDYTAEITLGDYETVSSVTAIGFYTLTLTGKDPYSGKKTLTFYVYDTIDLSTITENYEVLNGETLTGKLGSKVKITIADGATVTLCEAIITNDDGNDYNHQWAGLTCLGDATINLADGTENTVNAFHYYYPGIFIPKDHTLTIQGNGTLNATGKNSDYREGGSGIGGYENADCGNIIIKGGTINAKAYKWSPGIGCGHGHYGGYIRIEGGVVNAKGGFRAAGIGSGFIAKNGAVTITQDAVVTATKGENTARQSNSIGKGEDGNLAQAECGTVTIGCTLNGSNNPVGGHVGMISASPFTYFHYTVSFDGNGGSTTMATQEMDRGFDSGLIPEEDFTRTDYNLIGWVAENAGTTKFYPTGTKYCDLVVEPKTTVTLYAQWMKGDGSADAPYEIDGEVQWLTMADHINNGDGTYNSLHYKLTADISVTETVKDGATPASMIGTSESNAFKGTFDGNGHTITLNYTDERNEHYCGPFRFINGATIKNLHVTGTIVKTKKKHAGGIVGQAFGENTIENCRSSVDIQANTDGDGSHGGFIGDLRGGNTTMTGCTFDGKLRGPGGTASRTTKWGGFIGWVADGKKANFNCCVFAPAEVKLKSTSDSRTFARRDDGDDVTLSNCFYLQTLGSAQGSQAYSIRNDEHVSMDIHAPTNHTEYSVSGIHSYHYTGYDVIKLDGTLYARGGDYINLILSQVGDTPENYIGGKFIATPGSKPLEQPYTLLEVDDYRLIMPNANVIITLMSEDWAGKGLEDDPYLIYNAQQWGLIVSRVHSNDNAINGYHGKFFKLMADITLTEIHNSGNSSMMIGISTSNNTKFRGTFDGDGHTITLNITDNSSDDYCAPFRYLKDGTVKNLHVTGTITKADKKNAGGIVGKAEGNNTITACWSSVDIQFNKEGDVSSGGLVGELREGGTTEFINCLFDGKLRGTNAYCWGGFVGWVASGNTAKFYNCLFNPSEIAFDISHGDDNSKTFARKHDDGTVSVNNCYYKTIIKDDQGTGDASGMDNDALLDGLGDGWQFKTGEGVIPIMGHYAFDGKGTQGSPYVITSEDDWNRLADNVAKGQTYSGKYFQLGANITVSRMIGTSDRIAFQGNFDGAGNKLTFNWSKYNTVTAPFRYVNGATIENLHVTGTIYTMGSYTAGLMGRVTGETNIKNCRSSVTISGSGSYNGGFVAAIDGGTTTITGCLFDGKLQLNDDATYDNSGGFVGVTGKTASVTANLRTFDCLFDPSAGPDKYGNNCGTYSTYINTTDGGMVFTNSYYNKRLDPGDVVYQGRQLRRITAGPGITIEGGTTVTEYDVSGITGYIGCIKYKDVLYSGKNNEAHLILNYNNPGYTLSGYSTYSGTLEDHDNYYILKMPDISVTINATATKNTLELANATDNSEAINDAATSGKVFEVKLTDRTLYKDGNWNTLCLPFDLALEGSPLEGYGVQAMTLDTENCEFSGSTLWLNFTAATTIPAGTPFIIKWNGDGTSNIVDPVFTGVTISNAVNNATATDGCVTFTGTYAPVSIGDTGDNTKLYLGSGNKLYYPHAAMHINAFRSYFQLADGLTAGDPTTGARVLAFKLNFGDNDGDTAGIVSMSDVRSKMSDVWFDLSGRRLSSKPTQRGVYINGGIKVVIK